MTVGDGVHPPRLHGQRRAGGLGAQRADGRARAPVHGHRAVQLLHHRGPGHPAERGRAAPDPDDAARGLRGEPAVPRGVRRPLRHRAAHLRRRAGRARPRAARGDPRGERGPGLHGRPRAARPRGGAPARHRDRADDRRRRRAARPRTASTAATPRSASSRRRRRRRSSPRCRPSSCAASTWFADSAGPGRWRGGHAVRLDLQVLRPEGQVTARGMERLRFQPWGVAGGKAGATGRVVLNPGTPGERALPKIDLLALAPGDVLSIRTPGGGGHGNPLQRPAERVLADVDAGLVTPAHAREAYGVVVTAGARRRGGDRRAARRAGGRLRPRPRSTSAPRATPTSAAGRPPAGRLRRAADVAAPAVSRLRAPRALSRG